MILRTAVVRVISTNPFTVPSNGEENYIFMGINWNWWVEFKIWRNSSYRYSILESRQYYIWSTDLSQNAIPIHIIWEEGSDNIYIYQKDSIPILGSCA